MSLSPLAGQPAPATMRVNVPRLVTAYYAQRPLPSVPQSYGDDMPEIREWRWGARRAAAGATK